MNRGQLVASTLFHSNAQQTHPKTFSIFLSNREKKKGLVKHWLEVKPLFLGRHNIVMPDGTRWPLYIEPATQAEINKLSYEERITAKECLVSFQVFNDGEFFAVARLYKEKETQ